MERPKIFVAKGKNVLWIEICLTKNEPGGLPAAAHAQHHPELLQSFIVFFRALYLTQRRMAGEGGRSMNSLAIYGKRPTEDAIPCPGRTIRLQHCPQAAIP